MKNNDDAASTFSGISDTLQAKVLGRPKIKRSITTKKEKKEEKQEKQEKTNTEGEQLEKALLSFRDNLVNQTNLNSEKESVVSDISEISQFNEGKTNICLFSKIHKGEALFISKDDRIFTVPLFLLPDEAEVGCYLEFNLYNTGERVKENEVIAKMNLKYIKKGKE